MHPMIWFLILAPPCLAFAVWHVVGNKDFRAGIQPGWRPFKHGFWVVLGLLYVAMFAAAVVLHKL
jgi:hypothetical protein